VQCLHAQSTSIATPINVPGRFVDATGASHINFTAVASHTSKKYLIETMGSGVALLDFDNDGLLDVFFVNGAALSDPTSKGTIPQKAGEKDWNRLYRQKKDGTFEDVTVKAGLQGVGYGMGVAVGDYDNDGFEDLYVTAYGGNRLYHNNGNGSFTDVTERSGTAGSGWSTSAAWVDLDNDGLLDLVVLRYLQWDFDDIWCGERREGYRSYCHPDLFKAIPPLVYHNDGNGHFTEISAKIGVNLPGKGLGIAIADFDRDGHTDIAIANDSMLEFLYRNKGNGSFEEEGLSAGMAVDAEGRTYAGMGIDFQDYNNDGLPDLVITDLANQKYALYRNNGDGSFTYDTYLSRIAAMTLLHSGWGVAFLDYDNDGLKDLLIAQGHDLDTIELTFPQIHYREPMLLARNTGRGFIDVSAQSGDVFREPWVARGMAVGDIVPMPSSLPMAGLRTFCSTRRLPGTTGSRSASPATVAIATLSAPRSSSPPRMARSSSPSRPPAAISPPTTGERISVLAPTPSPTPSTSAGLAVFCSTSTTSRLTSFSRLRSLRNPRPRPPLPPRRRHKAAMFRDHAQ
jgi:hypothetical protein